MNLNPLFIFLAMSLINLSPVRLDLGQPAPLPPLDPLTLRFQHDHRKQEVERAANKVVAEPLHMWEMVEKTNAFAVEPWQRKICDRLELLTHQTGQRLLIHGPPQMGKSIIISQRFPAYVLGCNPLTRIRLACYNQTHAERFSAVNLSIMRSDQFRGWFPNDSTRVPNKCKTVEWYTACRAALLDAQPSFTALGLDSGFTGLGVDTLVVDDPYKNAAEADSDTINENIWNWWTQVVIPRLNPATNIVVMFHRWREKDFAGRLLEQGGWEYQRYAALGDGDPDDPMQRAVGVPLSPRYPKVYLDDVREKQGEMAFAGLYQGKPSADQGNMFKAAWFCPDEEGLTFWPASTLFDQRIIEAYICWDTAAKKGARNDTSAGCLQAMAEDGYVYVLPLVLGKMEVPDVLKTVLLQWAEWRLKLGEVLRGSPIEEGASNATAVVQFARLLRAERRKQEAAIQEFMRRGGQELEFEWKTPMGWELDEWRQVAESPPVILLPFPPSPWKRKRARAASSLFARDATCDSLAKTIT